ncbi:hypothetical protein [Arsenicicoccus dermatophilus]|nr:hypothetical protein [Arsenicicoccus dermatophilus]
MPRWTRIGLYARAVLSVCIAFALWGEAALAAGGWNPVPPTIALVCGIVIDAARRRRAAGRGLPG